MEIKISDKRNFRLKLSIYSNLILKSINMAINFVLVPLLLAFLGKENYGIWVTVYAVINWLNIFDIGLGEGLKLKLTEAFSMNKIQDLRKLISSTYYFVSLIAFFLLILFLLSYLVFNWVTLLNLDEDFKDEINISIGILTIFFLLVFVTKLIGVIYSALQLPFVENLIKTLSQIVFLVLLILMNYYEIESSLVLVSIFSVVPLFLIYLIFNLYFFKVKSPSLIPKVSNISKRALNDIIKPGFSFFAIQIGCIVLYTTDNLIIINLISVDAVTDYNVYYKYYSIPFLFHGIYVASHWSSFIDALAKKDYDWMKHKIKLFNNLIFFLAVCYILMFLLSEKIIDLWIGKGKVSKDNSLSIYMILYYLVSAITTNYVYVVNAYGKLKIQLVSYVIIAVVNIPLSIFFVNQLDMGSAGVILSSLLCLSILMVLIPIQSYKIIEAKATGIWNQ